MKDVPTTEEIRDLLVALTSHYAGGGEARWRDMIGLVEKLPTEFASRSNWEIFPGTAGTPDEREIMARAVALTREEYPIVA